uniref:Interleukin 18 receptor 1 n=1 Tax=Podarcis muralis TaxID=64176 RepID=A0A670J270_PODMU|nr:interleukin-18 receptor 1 [Podarcis muralis]XP_028583777.1 interleukin-18 receptor 1 [Podarcis muralis]XP_028583778.1 interleukin-18 receptor 1 [Podarcis muralis]
MYVGNLSVLLLMILSCASLGQLCPIRSIINIPEGEYFSICCPGVEQDRGYAVHWYKKRGEDWTLIQGDNRTELSGTYLEFWPAVLNDTGNYMCNSSNGKHNPKKWSLIVLQRSRTSCFNANHVSSAIHGILGRTYHLKCNDTYHKANVAKITWYKDCRKLPQTKEEWSIDELTAGDSGNFTCVKSFVHAGKRYNATKTIGLTVKEGLEEITKPGLIGSESYTILTEIGKKEILNCTAFLGYSNNVVEDFLLYWAHQDDMIGRCEDNDLPCEMEYHYQEEGKNYSLKQLWIKSVKEADINFSYICNFVAAGYPEKQIVTLQKETNRDIPLRVFTPGIIAVILLSLVSVLAVVLSVIFKADLVLLYRDVTGKDETIGDGKIYDAFVSYLKDSIPICDEERKFALNILPTILEKHFGYKLCLFERDISPGGAAVDDVQSYIDRSRRLIIILSKNYISDKVMFELETGLHKALVEKNIKVILIEYMPIRDLDFLPKSLKLLSPSHVLKWKEEKSLALNSRFWKKLRYAMPAKPSSMKEPTNL